MNAPIALFAYNRLVHVQKTLEALQKNEDAGKSQLIVFSDGPKSEADKIKVQNVRAFVKGVNGFKDVTLVDRAENLGLAANIIAGVTDIVNTYGKIIVIEDDMITSPLFLRYMNAGLQLYEEEEKVISICGYMYPKNKKFPEFFFIKGADCWGWATWKRGWKIFNKNGQELLDSLMLKKAQKEFDFNNSYPYVQMLKNQIDGKNNSWAIRWYASAFLSEKLTLYPKFSFVQNIGLDGSGTHCASIGLTDPQPLGTEVPSQRIAVKEDAVLRKRFGRALGQSFFSRFKRRVKNFLKGKANG